MPDDDTENLETHNSTSYMEHSQVEQHSRQSHDFVKDLARCIPFVSRKEADAFARQKIVPKLIIKIEPGQCERQSKVRAAELDDSRTKNTCEPETWLNHNVSSQGKGPFNCSYCRKVFMLSNMLEFHLRSQHMQELCDK